MPTAEPAQTAIWNHQRLESKHVIPNSSSLEKSFRRGFVVHRLDLNLEKPIVPSDWYLQNYLESPSIRASWHCKFGTARCSRLHYIAFWLLSRSQHSYCYWFTCCCSCYCCWWSSSVHGFCACSYRLCQCVSTSSLRPLLRFFRLSLMMMNLPNTSSFISISNDLEKIRENERRKRNGFPMEVPYPPRASRLNT